MANKKIGTWHDFNSKDLTKLRRVKISKKFKSEFIKNLTKIGYFLHDKRSLNLFKTIKAFQRHYRKELINGVVDIECLLIAKNILKNTKKP